MLPICRDDSKRPATIKHLLDVLFRATGYLNPGQAAVIGFEQPLYALAKKLQWYHPDLYGPAKLVPILGALHTEMVMLGCLGNGLQDSGWTIALPNSGVTTSANDSLLSGHDVAATKYVYQVTACTFYNLMKQAFQQSKCDTGREQRNLTFEQMEKNKWREQMELLYPEFQFCSIALKMQMDYLLFLRSIQSRKFSLYAHSLGKLLPWTFALYHYNYARWMPVHHYDMEMLQ